jgi:hypothetical protein
MFQTSSAPFEVKQKAIDKLKEQFGISENSKYKQILNDILICSAELKTDELAY